MIYIEQLVYPPERLFYFPNKPGIWSGRENGKLDFWKKQAAKLGEEYLHSPPDFMECLWYTGPGCQYRVLELFAQERYGLEIPPNITASLLSGLMDRYYGLPDNRFLRDKRAEFEDKRRLLQMPSHMVCEALLAYINDPGRLPPQVSPGRYFQYLIGNVIQPVDLTCLTVADYQFLENLGVSIDLNQQPSSGYAEGGGDGASPFAHMFEQ